MSVINIGSLNIDHVYKVPHFCRGGETLSAFDLTDSIGGKGLNQTIAVARSGVAVKHAGLIGPGGEGLKAYLEENGVDTSLIGTSSKPQGHTIIQVDSNGQNCIIVYGGSNRDLTQENIREILSHVEEGSYLMLQNEVSNIAFAVEEAAQHGIHVVLNASPIDDELWKIDFSELDWLVVNEIECMAVAEHTVGKCESPEEAFRKLHEHYPAIGILLTLGQDGSCCVRGDETFRQKAFHVKAVDTTGAGDTFVGYFVGCLSEGKTIAEAMELSSKASAITVTGFGAAPSIPYMKDVVSLKGE